MSFITKNLSKEIMKKSKLQNNFLKNKTHENRLYVYTKQRNYCLLLLKKSKKLFFENLHEKKLQAASFFRKPW